MTNISDVTVRQIINLFSCEVLTLLTNIMTDISDVTAQHNMSLAGIKEQGTNIVNSY